MRRAHHVMRYIVVAIVALASLSPQAQTAGVTLTVAARSSADASIAAQGALVAVAWGASAGDGAMDVFAAVSRDAGRTFAAPVRVNDVPGSARVGGEFPPRIAIARRGAVTAIDVLWSGRDGATGANTIVSARSDDGGRTFTTSRQLQQPGATGNRGWASLASDARAAHVLWLDHRRRPAATPAMHQHGAAATTPAAPAPPGPPAARVARDGVAEAQLSSLYYRGAAGEQELAQGVCYCCKTAAAVAPDGTIYAAWRHVYPGNMRDIAVTRSRDQGRSFAAPVRVSRDGWSIDGCPEDGPDLGIDAGGGVHLVWPSVTQTAEPYKALFYSTSSDGATFAARVRISPEGRNIAHPHIAVSAAGARAILWDELAGGRRRVYLRRAGSGAFADTSVLSGATTASHPVAAFSNETLLVAWSEGAPGQGVIRVRRVE